MRSHFDEQLTLLNNELIAMGSLCEEAIALAAKALSEGDGSLAKKVSSLEKEIDHKERDIESLCLKLLLHQQPVARDLRQISAALKMITDMELAKAVMEHDDVVDECFDGVKSELITAISQNPEDGEFALDLLMIAKYFERIGDHAVNIAEWVVFSIVGHHPGSR